jgi:RNA polymerase sigma factor (TIGR02999 family)
MSGDITRLLQGWRAGEPAARERLFELLYPQMRVLARRALAPGDKRFLETRELLHETFLRLVAQRQVDWQSRGHFFAVTATLVRRVLIDQARGRRRSKRDVGRATSLSDATPQADESRLDATDLLALDRALDELAKIDAQAAHIVELRYFAGLTLEEAAAAMPCARATVVRSWRFSRAFLAARLGWPSSGAVSEAP